MDRLQLGIRGHDMPKAPFEELVKSISDAGFCCTQLALAKAITEFHLDQFDICYNPQCQQIAWLFL